MRERFKKFLTLAETDWVVITSPVDLFYLTGLEISTGFLVLHASQSVLFVDGRYFEAARGLNHVEVQLGGIRSLWEWLRRHLRGGGSVALDSSTTSVAQLEQFCELAPQVNWEKKLALGQRSRMIKEANELQALWASAALAAEGFDFLSQNLKENISEKELARRLEMYWLERGGEGLAFPPIIAFGSHAAIPHHRPSDRRLQRGEVVLCDIGVTLNHYQSDMTRVLFFGNVSPEMREIRAVAEYAFHAACSQCRAGATAGQVDQAARDVIEGAGYGGAFTHSLGHGVGLEVHEMPYLRQKVPDCNLVLETGMVVTLEPGIYLPGRGGVRLEDTVVILDEGCQSLTQRPFRFPDSDLK